MLSTTEDERGVDVAQIQKLLKMTIAGRVAELMCTFAAVYGGKRVRPEVGRVS